MIGLGVFNYPYLASQLSQRALQRQFEDYTRNGGEVEQQDSSLEQARQYNQQLNEEQTALADAFAGQQDEQSAEEVMGYIEIKKIEVYLPIYEGTSDAILRKGVGHLSGSSLPVGGESTHAVLAGHSGLATQRMFTDLEQLEIGDLFSIYIPGEELHYQVDQILTVEPWQTEALEIEEGSDLVTLITCVPYGVNSHRLLVRGRRVEAEYQEPVQPVAAETEPSTPTDEIAPVSTGRTARQRMIFRASILGWVVLAAGMALHNWCSRRSSPKRQ